MTRHHLITAALLLTTLGTMGCRQFCRRNDRPPPRDGGYYIQPKPIPLDGPIRGGAEPPVGSPGGPGRTELLEPDNRKSNYRPFDEIVPPVGAVLLDPEVREDRAAPRVIDAEPPRPVESKKSEPAPIESKKPTNDQPKDNTPIQSGSAKDIKGFTNVVAGVDYGSRPGLEGLNWLQDNKYKTIVFLRSLNDDDSTDQKQVEKRQLTYHSYSIGTTTLTQDLVDDFTKLINTTEKRPIYVYAQDGDLAAALWFVYLRQYEKLTEDEAKLKVTRLGLTNPNADLFQQAIKLAK